MFMTDSTAMDTLWAGGKLVFNKMQTPGDRLEVSYSEKASLGYTLTWVWKAEKERMVRTPVGKFSSFSMLEGAIKSYYGFDVLKFEVKMPRGWERK